MLGLLWNDVMDSVHIQFSACNVHLIRAEGCSNCGCEITRAHDLRSWGVTLYTEGRKACLNEQQVKTASP